MGLTVELSVMVRRILMATRIARFLAAFCADRSMRRTAKEAVS